MKMIPETICRHTNKGNRKPVKHGDVKILYNPKPMDLLQQATYSLAILRGSPISRRTF
jgi:hypothetical protein